MNDDWIANVERAARAFAEGHSLLYAKSERQLFAAFEVGCFLSLVRFYQSTGFACFPMNLSPKREYRYLTTPNGNPANFSYIQAISAAGECQIRQQVRVRSHLHTDIMFTPDMLVMHDSAAPKDVKDSDYARGKRRIFFVDSRDVIAAHECKSTQPYPELLVSFIGMLVAAHPWIDKPNDLTLVDQAGTHLAPTLFVGGSARSLHRKMVRALVSTYPMNAVLGMHYGTWDLTSRDSPLVKIRTPERDPMPQAFTDAALDAF